MAGATLQGLGCIDDGAVIKAGATVGPYTVVGRQTHIEEDASLNGAILWPNTRVSREASVGAAIVGRNSHLGRNVTVSNGAVLGDRTTLTDFSRF